MSEFTGERLIPGQVDQDLWNEHIARYWFAHSLCTGNERVLDAGCGAGYGSSLLATRALSVLGFDIAAEAIAYAVARYPGERIAFVQGSCEAIPAPAESADLITAFEVIEHVENWRGFLTECERVLAPGGLLLVSTPNKTYYNEFRGDAGPNPFHLHEFERAEFAEELQRVFPHVRMMGQNHTASVIVAGSSADAGAAKFGAASSLESASFFVAVCGKHPIGAIQNFVYVPEAANVLHEREVHIRLLEGQLRSKGAEHLALVDAHDGVLRELERSNRWAESLDGKIAEQSETIVALQREVANGNAWAESLNREMAQRVARIVALQEELAAEHEHGRSALDAAERLLEERTEWARKQEAIADERTEWARRQEAIADERTEWARTLDSDLRRAVDALHAAEATAAERTAWALDLQSHIDQDLLPRLHRAEAEVERLSGSKWVRLGHLIHAMPQARDSNHR